MNLTRNSDLSLRLLSMREFDALSFAHLNGWCWIAAYKKKEENKKIR